MNAPPNQYGVYGTCARGSLRGEPLCEETMEEWPFADPPNVAVFTVKSVWQERRRILFVYHDADDGAWQFHADREPAEEDASILALEEIVELDCSVKGLADLPRGWCAWRDSPGAPWQRGKMD